MVATLRQELSAIRKKLDIAKILKKAAENNKWDKEHAAYALDQYVKHLYLCIQNRGKPIAAISEAGDLLWHQHILDTDKYSGDCKTVVGRFLDHKPIYGKPTSAEKKAYEDTQTLYTKTFGVAPRDLAMTSGNYSYTRNA